MIPTLLLALCMIAYGYAEGYKDADTINAGGPIDHVTGWWTRFGVAVLVIMVCSAEIGVGKQVVWGWPFVAYGAFNVAFRASLNSHRKMPLSYMSLSNVYDSVFIRLFGKGAGVAAYIVEGLCVLVPLTIQTF